MRNRNINNIPRCSAPWAAGWSSMSDISRIETDSEHHGSLANEPHHANPRERTRALGLAAAALAAVSIAATILL